MTPVQNEAVRFIRAYQAEHDGVSPCYDEIANWLGLKAKSGVVRVLAELKARGVLTYAPNRARSIVLTEAPSFLTMERWSDAEIARVMDDLRKIVAGRRVKGRAAA